MRALLFFRIVVKTFRSKKSLYGSFWYQACHRLLYFPYSKVQQRKLFKVVFLRIFTARELAIFFSYRLENLFVVNVAAVKRIICSALAPANVDCMQYTQCMVLGRVANKRAKKRKRKTAIDWIEIRKTLKRIGIECSLCTNITFPMRETLYKLISYIVAIAFHSVKPLFSIFLLFFAPDTHANCEKNSFSQKKFTHKYALI